MLKHSAAALGRLTLGVAMFAAASLAQAQAQAPAAAAAAYPTRPIKMVVPFPAGGATDLVARLVAGKMSEAWGQSVVVDNRPGASGMIGSEQVMRAPADGYTLLMTITTHIQNPAIFAKIPYDALKDFEPISQIALSYLVLAVKPEFPARDIKEFVSVVKATPGKYNFGSFGTGSSSHILGERFARVAGLDMTHVPYKGAAPLTTDLLGGQVSSGWVDVSTATPHIAAGKLRPLAISGPARTPMLPNVPTLGEYGYTGFEPLGWAGLMVAAGTPKPIIEKISKEVMRIVKLPDVQARLLEQTLVPVGDSPESFARTLRRDMALWAQVVAGAGIKPQ
ncbi:MAG TPA: tripartite tricarboxylate transporter substrate binding protein [Burkholderiaceae bacterium]|nr:tripartite tricarboxylate transporter substrate binding protein [Burkholderiaceae bacterium]